MRKAQTMAKFMNHNCAILRGYRCAFCELDLLSSNDTSENSMQVKLDAARNFHKGM